MGVMTAQSVLTEAIFASTILETLPLLVASGSTWRISGEMSPDKKDDRGRLKLNRRRFLQHGVLGSAIAFSASGAAQLQGETRSFDLPAAHSELEEATISKLQEGMTSGEFTARSITERYLECVDKLDKQGPAINAVLEINPDALAIADALDEERKTKGPRGPMHGIPVLIKDNIDTADRMTTTAGSLALEGSVAAQDSFVAQRLREAGAILLGKTNLSEWANFRSTRSTSGWSGRGGQTRNPYALDRNPCGSSSGSAVAVSANFISVAIGTETNGSIVCPSSVNSIVGIKPTVGLIGRSGIIPIAHSQDTAGPMARTVADAATLLGALTGVDPRDATTKASRGKSLTDYRQFLDPHGMRGARIGVARNIFHTNERIDNLVSESLEEMRRLGAEIIDPADIPSAGDLDELPFEVLLYEFKADLNAYLAGLGPQAPVRSLEEVIAFNERNREKEMPYFGQEIFIRANAKGPLTEKAYRSVLKKIRNLARAEGIDAVMRRHKLDALVAPTGGPPWMTDLVNGDHHEISSSTFAAVAGYPNITVPAGYFFGLPVGISFFGRAFSEPVLIRLAYAYEQATQIRKPPRFLPTADIGV